MRCSCHKQGWTEQEMTHKQDVCRKSGSGPHKVSKWSTEGLSMYNVNRQRKPSTKNDNVVMPNESADLQLLDTTNTVRGVTRRETIQCKKKSS